MAVAVGVRRVEVEGDSMRPALAPGDRVLAVRRGPCRPGSLVVLRDPGGGTRMLVKRLAGSGPEGLVVLGDNPGWSTDSRAFGPVPSVWGRVIYRYSPPGRIGWVR